MWPEVLTSLERLGEFCFLTPSSWRAKLTQPLMDNFGIQSRYVWFLNTSFLMGKCLNRTIGCLIYILTWFAITKKIKQGRDPAILEHAVRTSWIHTTHINFVKHTHFMKSTSAALSETGILVIVLWRLDECHPAYLYKPCRRPLKSSMVRGGGGSSTQYIKTMV